MNQKMKTAPAAENKMGTMPIGKLLFNMSLPMMISMLVQALYNIVDSIFVAKLSENALTAVSLASLTDIAHCSGNRYRCWYECFTLQSSWRTPFRRG